MTKVLLVEDDQSLGRSLLERLSKDGYSVTWETTFEGALQANTDGPADVAILDVGLPDGDGFSLARELLSTRDLPILFLTAMNSAEYRLEGYEIGADDYIPKPFHLRELLLRLKRVLDKRGFQRKIDCGSFHMIPDQLALEFETEKVTLAKSEYKVLEMLVSEAPKVVRRELLIEKIWPASHKATQRTLDNTIVRLRSTLKSKGQQECISTIRGLGYQWNSATKAHT